MQARSIAHEKAISYFNACIEWASENEIPPHEVLLLRKRAVENT